MFPWLAMGHLIPFLKFSNILAQKGHKISFISTPKNLQKLSKVPSSSVSLISFALPSIPGLPPFAETTTDVPYTKQQLLKKAFDLLESPLTTFLESVKPDWVIYDYASHWLPSIASKIGISSAFFSLFTAATLSFTGPPLSLMMNGDSRLAAEDFASVPKWVPFETNVKFHIHEVTKYVEKTEADETGPNDGVRFGFSAGKADVIIIRSSPEFESEWFDLYGKMSEKRIIPVGFLPPREVEEEDSDEEEWDNIRLWLDKKEAKSVVYVALGTEAALTQEEVNELALGLEKSRSPFFWVLKNPPGSTRNAMEMLPDGFEQRVKDHGVIYNGWVPQVKILRHEAVGVFLTHCGWNSIIEGLSFNRILILFPVLNDQGLNARLLEEKKLGLEIPRNELDGTFTSDSVAELVRKAKADGLEDLAKEMRDLFRDRDENNQIVEQVVHYLEENRIS